MHAELLERLDRLRDRGEDRDPDVLDEHVLGRGGAALHPVEDDDVGARLDRQRDVEVGARGADLDEDRLLPVGDLAQLLDLDLEVVGAGPVRVPAGAALVDALRQVAHLRDAVGDLLAEQHAAAAGLRALADDDLDRVGAAQVVGVHAVARGQQLVDERLGALALLGRHAAVAGRRARAHRGRAAAERLLRRRAERAEAHARDRDRDVEVRAASSRGACRGRRRCRSARGSPRAGSATRSRRGTAGRRSAGPCASRPSRGCRRCPRARRAGSRGSRCGRTSPTRAGPDASRRGRCGSDAW